MSHDRPTDRPHVALKQYVHLTVYLLFLILIVLQHLWEWGHFFFFSKISVPRRISIAFRYKSTYESEINDFKVAKLIFKNNDQFC